ncbi:GNAT family N-acetyltransferase [Nocardioides euryhalodurans]|uniref:N-acetyltransferase n=1 Tax=Nocardioides euryhalodurans TaxID=2518370 RepID=A0A4P7GM23_9ACTN|nr:GNAT family N-acetyltransferase [Nocardioides euryhalodurans]QBR92904.1 N-acetyltransferase [Nocardioides euryhalodurans]
MSRTAVKLTLDTLDALPAPCRSCLFWERDPVRRGQLEDEAAEKEAWVSEVLREWGSCGRVALVDDALVGYLVYAPAGFVPGAAGFATSPASADAVLLTTVYVDPPARGGGVGRMLVRAMAADLVERDIRAVEAFGTTARTGGRCQVPADFLSGVGFRTHRPHPTTPRMRMDLRSAVTWKDEVEAALERLVGVVRPAKRPRRAPEGAPRSGH